MEFDEIDQYVDQLFRREPQDGDIITRGNGTDRIDQVIEDAYQEVMDWHRRQISNGTDPESGLHGLPHVPWDERLDGVAAMQGAIGGVLEDHGAQWVRVGGAWVSAGSLTAAQAKAIHKKGLSCGEAAVIVLVVVVLILYMAVTL